MEDQPSCAEERLCAELTVQIPPTPAPTLTGSDGNVFGKVEVSSADAASLDVLDREQVLVFPLFADSIGFSTTSSTPIVPVALCSVSVSDSSGTTTTPWTSGKKKKRLLKVGEANIEPPSLVKRLFSQCTEPDRGDSCSGQSQVPSTPIISSPSSSGSKFSFARGGGGESPSRLLPSSQGPQHWKVPLEQRKVAIIPLDRVSFLPSRALGALLGVASKVILSTSCNSMSTTSPVHKLDESRPRHRRQDLGRGIDETHPSGEVLRAMVSRYCQGRYIQTGETIIDVPFLGRPIQLVVEKIFPFLEERDDRCNGTVEPGNDDKGELSPILSRLCAVLREMDEGCSVFYQIQQKTKIEFKPSIPGVETSREGSDVVGEGALLPVVPPPVRSPPRLVAGLESESEKIMSILLSSLFYPHMFAPAGGPTRPPRGILLHGASGVGKSRLAAQVGRDLTRAASGQRGKELIVEHVPTHKVQSYASVVGRAERELRRIFDHAESRASKGISTLLIIDDIHILCSKRGFIGSGGSGAGDMVASTLLALLDGIGSGGDANVDAASSGVVVARKRGTVMVLAMTSDPFRLDPAIRRPGRLDLEVEVPIPDEAARARILGFLLESLDHDSATVQLKTPFLSKQDVLGLARLAKGLTGADCSLALKEAVRCAASRCHQEADAASTSDDIAITVTHEDLMHAIRLTKPSTIRTATVEVPKVPWSSIGGMEDVKRQLRESVELPVTHYHLFESLKVPPPRGVLLFGPPGNSKTLMARAMATEGNMNFLAVKGPELLSKWLGESERALASLFRRARMASPAVIFFDELDAIASKRGSGGGSGERLLSQLLTELDGVRTHSLGRSDERGASRIETVVVVGATNRPDLIDPALTRPGRIDRKIYVGLPDEASRRGILKIGLKGKLCNDDVDIMELAKDEITGGYSGAELIAICRESALYALEDSGRGAIIGRRHLLRSIESTKRQITPEMLAFYKIYQNETP